MFVVTRNLQVGNAMNFIAFWNEIKIIVLGNPDWLHFSRKWDSVTSANDDLAYMQILMLLFQNLSSCSP